MNTNNRVYSEEIRTTKTLQVASEIVRVRIVKGERQHYAGLVVSKTSTSVYSIIWAERFWFPADILKGDEILITDNEVVSASPFDEATCNLLVLYFSRYNNDKKGE